MFDPAQPDFTLATLIRQLAVPITQPATSIVTPFFNTGHVFHQTARSLRHQTLQEWEWIIVDDGSTQPASLALLKEVVAGDARIRVIRHPTNLGLSAARNSGFAAARSPFVAMLDSDDLLEPTALEKWFWYLVSHPEAAFVKGYTVGFGAEHYRWEHGFHEPGDFLGSNRVNPVALVRRAIYQAVGGFDESTNGGLEDWDFWLKCANAGYWGGTVPEYLDWYRRRPAHHDRWADFDAGPRQAAYQAKLRRRYPKLWQKGFPKLVAPTVDADDVPDDLPAENKLAKAPGIARLLLLTAQFQMGGAERFALSLVSQLAQQQTEVTVCATEAGQHPWLAEFSRLTPDVFILPNILRPQDAPRFLRYLLRSRQINTVLISHCARAYQLLPYLRFYCPEVAFLDYNHIADQAWNDGGFARMSVAAQPWLDFSLVSSAALKEWMVLRGATAERIGVCYTGIDTTVWDPAQLNRTGTRQGYGIDDETPLLLYPARLDHQKRPRFLAQILWELKKRGLRFRCLVAGDGPERARLQADIRRYRLIDHTQLLGVVEPDRMPAIMAAADIVVLPSQDEGIALVLYEAMALGKPVVAADVGGQRELVTPEVGYLIPLGEDELAQYTQVLEGLILSTELCQKVGQRARERIQQEFTLQHMLPQLLAALAAARAAHARARQPTEAEALAAAQQAVREADLQLRIVQGSRPQTRRTDISSYTLLYWVKWRLLRPIYFWGLAHGMNWLAPLGARIARWVNAALRRVA
jgi:glycosyltransferase involved in cell wall biosynthesis/GT2 family glycosyltransferase